MKRFGQIAVLKPEKKEEYIKLHANTWPQVLENLKKFNIGNYTIYNFDLYCFSYFEYYGQDFEKDMQNLAKDTSTQKWWTFTKPCFQKFEFAGDDEYYIDMKEIFRMN